MSWLQLSAKVAAAEADALEERLWGLGAVAVSFAAGDSSATLEEYGEAPPLWHLTQVRALFDAAAQPTALLERLTEGPAQARLPEFEVRVIKDRDWVAAGRADLEPIRIVDGLWVCPSWTDPPDAGAVNLLMDPGLAFGSGAHATTRLCLRWLAAQPLRGRWVLDYGCGSGVLAIAALRLGARRALGVDVDPQALQVAGHNARVNGVDRDAQFVLPDCLPRRAFPIAVANILLRPLLSLAEVFARRQRTGQRLALSGVLLEQAPELLDAYAPWYDLDGRVVQDGWVLVSGRRR